MDQLAAEHPKAQSCSYKGSFLVHQELADTYVLGKAPSDFLWLLVEDLPKNIRYQHQWNSCHEFYSHLQLHYLKQGPAGKNNDLAREFLIHTSHSYNNISRERKPRLFYLLCITIYSRVIK